MISITIPEIDLFDEKTNEFITIKEQKIVMEHSLISLSKWESKWHKPFFSRNDKTNEEVIDYLRCMTITPNVDPLAYYSITQEDLLRINDYIEDPMTATTFSNNDRKSREIITSEIIYYWMVANRIPFECQKWHINRLLTLINVCSLKNAPPKKMSKSDLRSRNAALNAARRKALNSKG